MAFPIVNAHQAGHALFKAAHVIGVPERVGAGVVESFAPVAANVGVLGQETLFVVKQFIRCTAVGIRAEGEQGVL
ncbi:MAG: hypothetical protein KDC61_02360 [Saprospiraceae bacterium]|nr:hypothetical protein [Saprospiraceae bacterium]